MTRAAAISEALLSQPVVRNVCEHDAREHAEVLLEPGGKKIAATVIRFTSTRREP